MYLKRGFYDAFVKARYIFEGAFNSPLALSQSVALWFLMMRLRCRLLLYCSALGCLAFGRTTAQSDRIMLNKCGVRCGLLCLPVEQREATAWSVLAAAPYIGTLDAIKQATATLQREAPKNSTAAQYRRRVIKLTQILNESVGAEVIGNQDTSLNLKTMDTPISNAQWLQARCAEIGLLRTEAQRLAAIDALVNSTNPGPRGFCTA